MVTMIFRELKDKAKVDKLIYRIYKITPSVDYNYWLTHFDNHVSKATHQNSIKVPKVVKTNEKENVIIKLWGLV